MEIEQQIDFIKSNRRYRLDTIDTIGIISPIIVGLIAIIGFAIIYFRNMIALAPFVVGEICFVTLITYGTTKFLKTLKFQVVKTQLPAEENKAKIIQYLRLKNMEVLESSLDKGIIATYLNQNSFLFGQREMTIICDNNIVLLNLRSTVGRGIFTSNKQIDYFRQDIGNFINQLPYR